MPSIPASRSARATTLAPRSWPSRPGFAIRTRIFFAIRPASIEERLLPHPEDLPHHVADLAKRRFRSDRVEDERHRVRVPLAGLAQGVQRPLVFLRVPFLPNSLEAPQLPLERLLRHPEWLDLGLLVDDEVVHPHDDPLLVLDLPLVPVCGVRDLLLEEPLPDRRDHPAERLDAVEVVVRLLLHPVREALEIVRATERVHRIRDAALVGEDLLGPEGDADGLFVRHLVRLVVRIRVE